MYPIFLKLNNKPCLVVGGGKVAERKINSLVDRGAEVTVISPQVTGNIRKWIDDNKIKTFKKRNYLEGEAQEYFLIIAATDNPEINTMVSRDAQAAGKLVNVVDVPDLCNFYVPSTIKKGKLQIAISTSGAFPGMAKKLRKALSPMFTDQHEKLMNILDNFRISLKKNVTSSDKRMQIYNRILESTEIQDFIEGNEPPLERLLKQCS